MQTHHELDRCHEEIRRLKTENQVLRQSAESFGHLAERLNRELHKERRLRSADLASRAGMPAPVIWGPFLKELEMLYFFRRSASTLSCETRRNPDGPGFQLVITENQVTRIETFIELTKLLAREHELVSRWRAQGWRDAG